MNDQEKFFFLVCYALRGFAKPSDVYRIFHNALPVKRALYYLNKWERKGFYGDGVSEWGQADFIRLNFRMNTKHFLRKSTRFQ